MIRSATLALTAVFVVTPVGEKARGTLQVSAAPEFTIRVTNQHHLPVRLAGVRFLGSSRVSANTSRTLTARCRDREFYLLVRVEGGRTEDPRGGAPQGDVTWYTNYYRVEEGGVLELELPSRFDGDPRFRRERP